MLALGGGTFVQPANAELLRSRGAHVVFLETDLEELLQRCQAADQHTPTEPPATRWQRPETFRTLYAQRLPYYRTADLTVNADRKGGGRAGAGNRLEDCVCLTVERRWSRHRPSLYRASERGITLFSTTMPQQKIPVGILGATGVVGQRFIQLLEAHPWFEVAWLAASDRSAGQAYGDAVRWRLKTPIPELRAWPMRVSNAAPEGAPRVIFAALDAGIARDLEPQFAAAGCAVVSNSSAFRMQENVPLVVPEVNAGHIALIEKQCWRKQSGGYIVTNPNCSAIGLVVALAPLHQKFGIESLFVYHHASGQRCRLSGSSVPRYSRQRHPLHRQRRREDGGGDPQTSWKIGWRPDRAGNVFA